MSSSISIKPGFRRGGRTLSLRSGGVITGVAVSLCAVGLGIALEVAPYGWITVGAALAFAYAVPLAVLDWRRWAGIFLCFLPFSGLASLMLFPRTYLGDVVTDLIFVAPLYFAFFMRRARPHVLPQSVRIGSLLLVSVVLLGLLNPGIPTLSVGLIGARGWLFYMPLIFIGAELASDAQSALRVAWYAALAGLPALVVGLCEAVLLATHHSALLYRIYGSAAGSAFTTGTRDIQGASVSLGALHRVPSLFAFTIAYYGLCMAMLVPGYFLWRAGRRRRERVIGEVVFALACACALSSGTRFAFVAVPTAVLVTLYLDGVRTSPRLAAVGVGVGAFIAIVLHVPILSLPQYLIHLGKQEGAYVLIDGVRSASRVTLFGLGPGTDTNATRSFGGSALFQQISGHWQESYVVKSWIELGAFGLIVVMWFLLSTTRAVAIKAARAGKGRPLVAATSGFLVATLLISVKGAVLDQAPTSPYFWLFAGIGIAAAQWGDRRHQVK